MEQVKCLEGRTRHSYKKVGNKVVFDKRKRGSHVESKYNYDAPQCKCRRCGNKHTVTQKKVVKGWFGFRMNVAILVCSSCGHQTEVTVGQVTERGSNLGFPEFVADDKL